MEHVNDPVFRSDVFPGIPPNLIKSPEILQELVSDRYEVGIVPMSRPEVLPRDTIEEACTRCAKAIFSPTSATHFAQPYTWSRLLSETKE